MAGSLQTNFNEARFRQQVENALKSVARVLDVTRNPQYPGDVPHQYEDKYNLAEYVVNTAIASTFTCLEQLGISEQSMRQLIAWSRGRSVTIRLTAEEKCVFLKEETRKEDSKTQVVVETSLLGSFGSKVVTKITEFFWQFDVSWQLQAYVGTGSEQGEQINFVGRQCRYNIVTSRKDTPRPLSRVAPAIEENITWLLANADDNLMSRFRIDRTKPTCRTPRRNEQVDEALAFFARFHAWSRSVQRYLQSELFDTEASHGFDMSAINAETLFVPVLPLMEQKRAAASGAQMQIEGGDEAKSSSETSSSSSSSALVPSGAASAVVPASASAPAAASLLSFADLSQFLNEQRRTFAAKQEELTKIFPAAAAGKLISVVEAKVTVTLQHLQAITQALYDAVNYIEHLLRKQLIAAVGRELSPVDFANYMRFHNRKFFRPSFEPRPFSYAIRRPDHYPEGVLSITSSNGGADVPEPVVTMVRSVDPALCTPMQFAINAATNVVFRGQRYLHAWMSTSFAGSPAYGSNLSLTARANQFSCFLLMVGTIGSATVFEPKHAIIIQNKDELKIPLLLEQLPTARAFRDAIESLSPEQQRFAKAIRSMQLEGSLFGVCVVQLKPQLEKLLKLPDDSLTKEIKLTQDLLELFIKYQIPSDLLTYEGDPAKPVAQKLATVQGYVTAMQGLIKDAKAKDIAESAELAAKNQLERLAASAPPTAYASFDTSFGSSSPAPGARYRSSGGAMNTMSMAFSAPPPPPMSSSSPMPAPMPMMALARNAPAPAPAAAAQSAPEPVPASEAERDEAMNVPGEGDASGAIDWTKIPVLLDRQLEALDEDAAVRSTIIKCGSSWTKRAQKSILSPAADSNLYAPEQTRAKQEAFDLLDALSRSGVLSLDAAELHIIVAATHTFDKSLIDTVIQQSVNPIEKLERSQLIVASAIHDVQAGQLLRADVRERLTTAGSACAKILSAAPMLE